MALIEAVWEAGTQVRWYLVQSYYSESRFSRDSNRGSSALRSSLWSHGYILHARRISLLNTGICCTRNNVECFPFIPLMCSSSTTDRRSENTLHRQPDEELCKDCWPWTFDGICHLYVCGHLCWKRSGNKNKWKDITGWRYANPILKIQKYHSRMNFKWTLPCDININLFKFDILALSNPEIGRIQVSDNSANVSWYPVDRNSPTANPGSRFYVEYRDRRHPGNYYIQTRLWLPPSPKLQVQGHYIMQIIQNC